MTPQMRQVRIGDANLSVAVWNHHATDEAEIVLLHDGLGSIRQWRGLPEQIAQRTSRQVLAYDRPGHGSSTPAPRGPWPTEWLHHEAARLAELLASLGCERPLLVGHSDGGSIALIAAMNGLDVAGVVAIAAHTWVEPVCREAIENMRENAPAVVAGLARFHEHPSKVFQAWSGVWVSDAFKGWDIRSRLHRVEVPTILAQGDADEYATPAMLTDSVASIGANAFGVVIAGGRHVVHHEDPDAIVELVVNGLASVSVDAGFDHTSSSDTQR
ncbi:MAG: alpha/beta hydrolase [Acidimicrobiia bacterium]|nr:alpha/beta hydrolase [Acidimicrobiia bacterium]